MKNRLILSAVAVFCALCADAFRAEAQNIFEQTVSFDKIVYDFGDIMLSDGPQSLTPENYAEVMRGVYKISDFMKAENLFTDYTKD